MAKAGRSTVYNDLTSEEKLAKANEESLDLEEDFLEHLVSVDRAETTITQYRAALHILWCWNLDYNKNKSFVEMKKREVSKFQNMALNEWGWSPRRMRFVKSVMRSLENFIIKILDDEYPNYQRIWDKIENPVNEAVREQPVFTDEELEDLLNKLVEKKEYMKACVLALMIYGGRRKAEIPRFKVSYFNKENLICEGALYKTPEKIKTKGRGQRGKLLYCYTLAKPFQPYLDMWLEERVRLNITSDWLFPMYKDGKWLDEPMNTTTMDSYSRTFTRLAGKPWFPHLCRHRATTRYVEAGIPANVIKDIFGWSDVSLVDVYSDLEAENTFDKYFGAEGIKKVEQKGLEDL
ncbi:site-specific integrase [Ruminococcus sp. YE282]|uniref:tyrosine-type recombinase/integrase n=1 Tax=Ruminococcus sp. YE282 TaxID=3158780 RepID=UPI00087E1466|nr:Site-specific recombinase XerD [Ruminococcus bromii]